MKIRLSKILNLQCVTFIYKVSSYNTDWVYKQQINVLWNQEAPVSFPTTGVLYVEQESSVFQTL